MTIRKKEVEAVWSVLQKGDMTASEQESLLELLELMVTSADKLGGIPDYKSYTTQLAEELIKNKDLLAVLRRKTAELDALRRITLKLTSSLELPVVLGLVVQEAMQLVKEARDAHIFLYQEGKLSFGAALDIDGRRNMLHSPPRPQGLTYTVARRKKVIVVEDIFNHPLFADNSHDRGGSIIGIPLTMESRVVGVMNLARSISGPFAPSEIHLLAQLADQAAIAIVNARLHQAVNRQARSDVLTGLPNRRALDERLEEEISRSDRSAFPFSVIMMDLDGFKAINDTYGHDTGDEVLRDVSASLSQTLRSADFLARYGGDELTLILSETSLPQAQVVIDKVQKHLRRMHLKLPDGKRTRLSISGGIALYPFHAKTAAGLLRSADEALYRAKKTGRGQFLVAEENH